MGRRGRGIRSARARRRRHPPERCADVRRRGPARRGDRGDRRARRAPAHAGDRRDGPGLLPYRAERQAPQFESFEAHIALAKKHGIAMQIHDRDAHDAVLETLSRVGAPERTVFHCISGDDAMARVCADAGYHLSFRGERDVQERPEPAGRAERSPRSIASWSRRMRRSSPRCRCGVVRMPRTSCRSRCASWPPSSALRVDELCAQLAENTLRVYGSFAD